VNQTARGQRVGMGVWGVGTGILAAMSAAALMPLSASAQSRCEHREDVQFSITDANMLDIGAGSGSLDVRGEEGLDGIRVVAILCASDADDLRDLSVELSKRGSGASLSTEYPDRRPGFGTRYARIDLEVRVPAGLNLKIDDGSGSMSLENIGDVEIEDGSGSVRIDGAGSVRINDGSGDLDISNVSGDVDADDGSGGMKIRGVSGAVRIEDGSGSIVISDVGGSVWMGSIGSGAVSVKGVTGGLTVKSGRRSRIDYSNVEGEIDLPRSRKDRRRGRRN